MRFSDWFAQNYEERFRPGRRIRRKRASRPAVESLEHRDAPAATIIDIFAGATASNPSDIVAFKGKAFFAADDGNTGVELWSSDGTVQGTKQVANIRSGAGASNPDHLTVVGNTLYFTATDGTDGVELYKTDGTTAGTSRVLDINPGAGSSSPLSLTAFGNLLIFSADDGVIGRELWKSDGTSGGTIPVKNINAGAASSNPGQFSDKGIVPIGAAFYFAADDGTTGVELWKSDGNPANTVQVKNINPGAASSFPQSLTVVGTRLLFTADDGTSGTELWKSDGDTGNTLPVRDINAGAGSSSPTNLTNLNGVLLTDAIDGTNGNELFRSDGSEPGTSLITQINPGPGGAAISGLRPEGILGTSVYFQAFEPVFGAELYKSDGSANGTTRVANIAPGATSSNPAEFTKVGTTVFFTADDGTNGTELWQTDGTPANTKIAADIFGGPANSSFPQGLVNVNGTLFFSADDGAQGRELVAFTVPQPAQFQLSSATYNVNEGQGVINVVINRTGDLTGTPSVTLTIGGGNATAGTDYTATPNQVLNFAAGESAKTVPVLINSDNQAEGNETVNIQLSGETGATLGAPAAAVLTISDAAPPPQPGTIQLGATTFTVAEGGGQATITLTRTGGSDGAVSVQLATVNTGSATGGSDYTGVTTTVNFAAGETTKTVQVPILNDTAVEGNETFNVALSAPTGGAALGTSTGVVTITDDDTTPPTPPAPKPTIKVLGGTVTAKLGVALLRGKITIRATNVHGNVTLKLSAPSGKFIVTGTGLKVSGNKSKLLTLTGPLTRLNTALRTLSLRLTGHGKIRVAVTTVAGTASGKSTVVVVF